MSLTVIRSSRRPSAWSVSWVARTFLSIGSVATELTDHITHAETKQATQQFVKDLAITPQDIAEVIASLSLGRGV
jgi:NADP-dependent 3-hydroxy acid dehydrogenase YdfG